MTCAARNTRSSSPSAKATRFCAVFAAAKTGSMLEPDWYMKRAMRLAVGFEVG